MGGFFMPKQIMDPIKIDADIDKLLKEAEKVSARNTPEYAFGRQETLEKLRFDKFKSALDKLRVPAEAYLQLLSKVKPELKINQVRIGLDYSSNEPVILTIFSEDEKKRTAEIQQLAKSAEMFFWEQNHISVTIWTLIERNIDKTQIDRDFPCVRINSDAKL